MTTNSPLAAEQARTARWMTTATWAHAPALWLVGWMVGGPALMVALLSGALALLAEATLRLSAQGGRIALAVALIGQAALAVGVLAGHPWQVDAHMYFFALLAALSALADIRVILVAAAAVALHHLALNFALPALIYPGGANLGRTIMHAAILILETAALTTMIANRLRLQALAEREAVAAHSARDAAAVADERSAETRKAMMETLEAHFSRMAERGRVGDFSRRIDVSFDDPAMTRLASAMNAMFATVDGVLTELQARMTDLARGDLAHEMTTAREGRFEECRGRFNETVVGLRQLIGGISSAASGAREATGGIGADARNLSGQAGAQAAAIEETAAAMEEIAATVTANSARLTDAERLAREAAEKTRGGESAAARAVDAVSRIERSSQKITDIIALIDGIAFQTNLLALNAGVEAARAGEAGRGFAVVATEVRTLAQRTATAAADVGALIRDSADAVKDGVRMVEDTGGALTEIAGSVQGLISTVAEISRTSREQSIGVSDINAAISRIDAGTQAAAALAQRSALAATELEDLVGGLDALIARFDLGGERLRRTA